MNRRQFFKVGPRAALGAAGLAAGGSYYATRVEPRWLQQVEVDIWLDGPGAALDGLTIGLLSDLHVGRHSGPDQVARAAAMIAQAAPDLVVLPGDFVLGGSRYAAPCAEALQGLEAPLGAFATVGNHDVWDGPDEVTAQLERRGLDMLRNEARSVVVGGNRLWLIGLDDAGYTGLSSILSLASGVSAPGFMALWQGLSVKRPSSRFVARWTGVRRALEELLAGLPPDEPRILLVHNPDFAELLGGARIDLMLSGHTHGGQIRVPGMGALVLPSSYGQKYTAGLVRAGSTQLYVTRGVGVNPPAVRFCCRPEVTLLRLHGKVSRS